MNQMAKFAKKVGGAAKDVAGAVRAAFRGKITLINSTEPIQHMQVDGLAGETLQDLEHFQQFGFTSHPPVGSEAVIIPLGGATSHGIVVATQNGNYRIKNLKSGETAIYSSEGAKIVIKQGRIVEVDCDVFKVNCQQYQVNASSGSQFTTPTLETSAVFTAQGQINGNGGMAVQGGGGATFSGNVNQNGGNFNTTGDVMASGKSLVNHTHTGDSGGSTSSPL